MWGEYHQYGMYALKISRWLNFNLKILEEQKTREFGLKLSILFVLGEKAKRKSSKERSQECECTGKWVLLF